MLLAPATAFRITAVLGFLAVALGAFGAHGLEPRFAQIAKAHEARFAGKERSIQEHAMRVSGPRDWWEKAVLYQFVHVLAMLGLARSHPFRAGVWGLFAAGILIFSGSLYVLALTGYWMLGAVTPLGGLCFLGGWLWLALGKPPTDDRA